ncbi:hypothetical protein K440DRAFT_627440 [Wilcoxina mikolae CBS 423.85]|nr:hypothetical protein K440DRAFT_627440 [Wilcoxina mikolae CBS 423.85]
MEFRRLACTTAVTSSRPLLSLYPRTLRQFSTSALRANNGNDDEGTPSARLPQALTAESIFGSLMSGSTISPSHRSNYGSTGINSPPLSFGDTKPPKMGPTAGRSVLVTTDLAQAFMRLKSIISQNKVRQDFHIQKFHERPGLKRKRLRSERHRRRFKEGFKRMVSIVMDMKKKGM